MITVLVSVAVPGTLGVQPLSGLGVTVGLDVESSVEASAGVLPGNQVSQLDSLFGGEVRSDAGPKVVVDADRSCGQCLGVFDHQFLFGGQFVGGSPIADSIDCVLIETQLTAECSSKIVSPHATDDGRRPKLRDRLEPVVNRTAKGHPSFHCKLAEQGRFVLRSHSVGARHCRTPSHHFHCSQDSHINSAPHRNGVAPIPTKD